VAIRPITTQPPLLRSLCDFHCGIGIDQLEGVKHRLDPVDTLKRLAHHFDR